MRNSRLLGVRGDEEYMGISKEHSPCERVVEVQTKILRFWRSNFREPHASCLSVSLVAEELSPTSLWNSHSHFSTTEDTDISKPSFPEL